MKKKKLRSKAPPPPPPSDDACKQGGQHDEIQIHGLWYCKKCNKHLEEEE